MFNNASVLNDARKNLRVKENRRISWSVLDSDLQGKCRVRNISLSGMMVETNNGFQPQENYMFSFDSQLGYNNYIPQKGQMVWQRQEGFFKNKRVWGVRFTETPDYLASKLRYRVQEGIRDYTRKRQLVSLLGFLLVLAAVAAAGYAGWLGVETYQRMEKSNAELMAISEQQAALTKGYNYQLRAVAADADAIKENFSGEAINLTDLSRELKTTKAILAQTEQMLTEAKVSSSKLQDEVESIKKLNERQMVEMRANFEGTINTLQSQNTQLAREVESLQSKIDYYEGNIRTHTEGQNLLSMYYEKLRDVKGKMWQFRRKAQQVKDRIQQRLGNQGFLVKDGAEVQVDMAQYNGVSISPDAVSLTDEDLGIDASARTPAAADAAAAPEPERKVDVGVQFFD